MLTAGENGARMGWTRPNEDPQLSASEAPIKIVNGIFFVHRDHLGSSSITTDADSVIKQLADYFPYGKTHFQSDSDDYENDKLYTGKELDEEFGLYYYGARYYHPEIGRFLSQDPSVLAIDSRIITDPQAQNYYTYAKNNPVKFIDPDGKFAWLALVVGFVAGMAIDAAFQYFESGQNISQYNLARGLISGGLSALSAGAGYALAKFGAKGVSLATGMYLFDTGAGTAIDVYYYGQDFDQSVVQNALSNLAGEAGGYAVGKTFRLMKGIELKHDYKDKGPDYINKLQDSYTWLRSQGIEPVEHFLNAVQGLKEKGHINGGEEVMNVIRHGQRYLDPNHSNINYFIEGGNIRVVYDPVEDKFVNVLSANGGKLPSDRFTKIDK